MATVDVSDLEDLIDELRSVRDTLRKMHGRLLGVEERVGSVEDLLGGAGAMLLAAMGGALLPEAPAPAPADELAVSGDQASLGVVAE